MEYQTSPSRAHALRRRLALAPAHAGAPVSRPAAEVTGPPLFGREPELASLEATLRRGAAPARLVVVQGPAGSGKTALATELHRRAHARGIPALWVGAAAGRGRPLLPWIEAVQRYRRGLDCAPGQMHELVPRILDHAGDRCLVVVDDADRADVATLDLLVTVATSAPRTRIVVLSRAVNPRLGGALGEHLEQIERARGCEFISLGPLSRGAAGKLIAHLAGREPTRAELDSLYESSAGDPFLLSELTHGLAAEPGAPPAAAPAPVPATVRGAIGLRLAAMAPEARAAVELAAMFSGEFAFHWLRAATQMPDDELLGCVEEAERAGLLRAPSAGRFDFSAPLLRHVIRSDLPDARRALLHRRIALSLEGVAPAASADGARELALQYQASASLPGAERGIVYAVIAAEHARRSEQPAAAAELLELALDLLGDADSRRRAKLLGELARAQADAQLTDAAICSLQRALAVLGDCGGSRVELAELAIAVGGALGGPFTVSDALGRAPIPEIGGDPAVAMLRARLDQVAREVAWESSGFLRVARIASGEPAARELLWQRGTDADCVLAAQAPDTWSEGELSRWLRRIDEIRDPHDRTTALLAAGLRALELHPSPELVEWIPSQVERRAARLGAWQAFAAACALRSITLGRAGRLAAAHRLALTACELASQTGGPLITPPVAQLVKWLLEQHLDPDHESLARRAWARATEHRPRHQFTIVFACLAALSHARAQDPRGAELALRDAIPALERSQPRERGFGCALALAAETAATLLDVPLAQRLEPLAARLIASGAGDFYMTQRELTLARIERTLGREEAAALAYGRARVALHPLGERPLTAIVDYEQGTLDHARPDGNESAPALLEVAHRQFEQLGMTCWRERLEAHESPRWRPHRLTSRQLEVLRLLATGLTNREIAERLVLSVHTVDRHVTDVYGKIGARNRAEATAFALRRRL